MKGIKPYINVTGRVFDIYECAAEKSCDTETFKRDSIMGALLLGESDPRIDELNKILGRVTSYSEMKIPRKKKSLSRSENQRKDSCKADVLVAIDHDDRLIYTYRPFMDLASPDKAKRKSRVKKVVKNTKQ